MYLRGGHFTAVAVYAFALAGCGGDSKPAGETNAQVWQRYDPLLAAKKQEIIAVMTAFTDPIAVSSPSGPAPFHRQDFHDTNIAMFPADTLADGGVAALELAIASPLKSAMSLGTYMADRNDDPASPDLIMQLDRALATPFIGVYYQTEYKPAALMDYDGSVTTHSFKGGYLAAEALLVELDARTVVASCAVDATPSATLTFGNGEGLLTDQLVAEADKDMRRTIRMKIAACFAEQAGGEFDFEN
jgi:hypothetical protein